MTERRISGAEEPKAMRVRLATEQARRESEKHQADEADEMEPVPFHISTSMVSPPTTTSFVLDVITYVEGGSAAVKVDFRAGDWSSSKVGEASNGLSWGHDLDGCHEAIGRDSDPLSTQMTVTQRH